MKIFKNKWFTKFAKSEGMSDKDLCRAVHSADKGLVDADYGGGVIKQRIPRQGEGKSGGFRSIILYKKTDKAFFVYGFAKNAQQNIKDSEINGFKKLAKNIFELTDTQLEKLIISKEFTRVQCHEE